MKAAWIVFDLKSYWHAGTGRGAGPELDAVVVRTPEGLPVLPGRTASGLLREVVAHAWEIGAIEKRGWEGDTSAPVWCFGTELPKGVNPDNRVSKQEAPAFRFATNPGHLRIESAILGESDAQAASWRDWARDNQTKIAHLYTRIASTKIDNEGIAEDETLRAVEVVVPVVLHARVTGPDGKPWIDALKAAVPFLRSLGSHRNRGLGRVAVTVREVA